jgi:hypothetical protein
MRKYLLFWVVVLLGVMSIGLLVSCRDDVIVPSPPSLVGNYKGYYSLDKSYSDTLRDTLRQQLVTFRFTQETYAMSMDTSVSESDRIFCDVMGDYTIGTGAVLVATDSNATKALCTENWAPDGSFSLDQTSDTTKLTRMYQDGEATITMKLHLKAR